MVMGSCEIASWGEPWTSATDSLPPAQDNVGRRLCYQPTGWSLVAMNGEQRLTVD